MAEKIAPVPRGERLDMLPDTYVCLDLETTGFSPRRGSEILEIAAVLTEDFRVVREFSRTVRPRGDIPPAITFLTGISREIVRFSGPIETVLPEFLELAGDLPVVGHNVTFDLGFLSYYSREVTGRYFLNPYVDTLQLSRSVFTPARCGGKVSHSLEALSERLEVEAMPSHRALRDVYATHQCYRALTAVIAGELLKEEQ
ncbi:MAG: 3'-5' exonuclease [Abditibacteriota bacterium]|nr:3'-5' exonuclease [Abditibacteriota bacterium]